MQSDVQVETSIGGVCLPNPPLGTKFSQSPICDSFAPSCPASSSHHEFDPTQLLTQLVFDEVPVLTTPSLSLKQFAVKALNRIAKIRFASVDFFFCVDLTKTIDRVEHNQLFQALREQHVPQSYIVLLRAIYSSQSGAVHGNRVFDIQRGVK